MSKNIVNRDLPSRGHSAAFCVPPWVRTRDALADEGKEGRTVEYVITHYRPLRHVRLYEGLKIIWWYRSSGVRIGKPTPNRGRGG
jgi:hypothetical protein